MNAPEVIDEAMRAVEARLDATVVRREAPNFARTNVEAAALSFAGTDLPAKEMLRLIFDAPATMEDEAAVCGGLLMVFWLGWELRARIEPD